MTLARCRSATGKALNEFQRVLQKAKEREESHHRRAREAVYADAAAHPERWHGVDVHRRAMADWWLDPAMSSGGFRVRSETELAALSHVKAEAEDAQPGRVKRLVALNEAQVAQYRSALREVLAEEKHTPPQPSPELQVTSAGRGLSTAVMPIVVMPVARMAMEIIHSERPAAWQCFRLGQRVESVPAMTPIVGLPVERMAWSQVAAG